MASSFSYVGPQTKEEYYAPPRFARPDQTFGPAAPTGNPLVDMGIQPRFVGREPSIPSPVPPIAVFDKQSQTPTQDVPVTPQQRLAPSAVRAGEFTPEERESIKRREQKIQLKQAVEERFGPARSFGDFIFNKIPLASGYLKKTAEATEKYYQMREKVPPALQQQMEGNGVLHDVLSKVGKNVLEMGVDMIELVNAAIPVNSYSDVKNLMNATRMHYGLTTEEDLQKESAMDSRLSEIEGATDHAVMLAKEFVGGFKKAATGSIALLREKDPAKRREMADQMSFDFFSGLGSFAGFGSAVQQAVGVTSDNNMMYVKGVPVSELSETEKKVAGGMKAVGALANSFAIWSKVSPWIGHDVIKTFPALKGFAKYHPILFQGFIESAHEEMFQAVASNIAGVPYNFGDTMFGMAMQMGFTLKGAAGARLKGVAYDPVGFAHDPTLKDIDYKKATAQLENAYESFTAVNGRMPSNNEMQTILLDQKVAGTDMTWGDVHQYLAHNYSRAFGENRLAALKQEGRAGIEIPTEPPRFGQSRLKTEAATPRDYTPEERLELEKVSDEITPKDLEPIERVAYLKRVLGKERFEAQSRGFKASEDVGLKRFESPNEPKGYVTFRTTDGGAVDIKDGYVHRWMDDAEFQSMLKNKRLDPSPAGKGTQNPKGTNPEKYFSVDDNPLGGKAVARVTGSKGNLHHVVMDAKDLPDMFIDRNGPGAVYTTKTIPISKIQYAGSEGKVAAPLEGATPVRSEMEEARFAGLRGKKEIKNETLYHGTYKDFKGFTKKNMSVGEDRTYWGEGYYLTPNKIRAQDYATGKDGKVVEVQADLKNPLYVKGRITEGGLPKKLQEEFELSDMGIREFLMEKGYDGVVDKLNETTVVFEPSKMKVLKGKSKLEGGTPVRSEFGEARFAGLRGKKPIEGEMPDMNRPLSDFSPQGKADAEAATKLEAQGKTPEEAAHILAQIGDVQSRTGRLMTAGRKAADSLPRFGKKVDQTFRTEKFNLDDAGQTRLKQVQKSLGLMERDVRSWPEVEEMAKEIGQNPLELMKRVQGNRLLTDAEVEALRQTTQNASEFLSRKYDLLDEARSKGDTDAVRDIQQKAEAYEKILDASVRKLIGGGTELGRGVAIYRKIAARKFDDPTYWYKEAAKLIEDQKTVRVFAGGKDTKVSVEEGKFPEPLRKAIDDLVSSKDQLGMAQLMAHLRKSGNIEKAVTLWKSGLLSAPTTHLANILGNTTMRGLEEVKDIPATIIDALISPITKQRTKVLLSPTKFKGEVQGIGEGLQKGWEYMKTGVDIDDVMKKWDLPQETHFDNAILEGYTQSIFRSLGAEDMAFRYPALRRSIAEQAVVRVKNMSEVELKDAIENLPAEMPKTKDSLVSLFMQKPSDEMAKIAMEDADYASFHRETLLSTLAKGARQSARRRFGSTGTLPVEFVAPFVRTPSAVASTIVDYSPAGFIKESLTQLAKKGFDQKRFVEAAGRSSVGTAVIAIGAEMARQGLMTGNAPEDPAERKLWSEAGKQPNSVFVFGKWRKLDRMSPMGNLLTIGAEWDELGREKPRAQQIAQTAAAGAKSLTQQTFLMGVSQAVETLSQPERNLENYVENSVRGLVPNVIAKVAQGADPLRRESDPWNFLHYFGNRIPILSKELPAQQNVFGIPMKNQRGIMQALFDPFSSQAPTTDPVIKELLRLNRPVSRPAKGEYSPQEYRRMMELRGKTLYPLLRAAVENPQWKVIGDDDKRKLIEDFSSDATRQVNASLKLGVANRLAQELSEVSANDRMRRLEKIRERDNDLYWMIEAAALSQNSQ